MATTEGVTLPGELVTALRDDDGPPAVVCATDRHLLFAAVLAEAVGAPFAPVETARTLRDKRCARELYEELGIASPRWTEPRTAEELAAFVTASGAPVVLKNCRGTGSLDVLLCRTPHEAATAFRTLSAAGRYLDGELMAEVYVNGPLYSLETLVADGRCRHLGVTDRQLGPRPPFCEVSYTFPVEVPPEAEARMRKAVETLGSRHRLHAGDAPHRVRPHRRRRRRGGGQRPDGRGTAVLDDERDRAAVVSRRPYLVAGRRCGRDLHDVGGVRGTVESRPCPPRPMQRLLRTARWDADALRDDVRAYVHEHLGDDNGC